MGDTLSTPLGSNIAQRNSNVEQGQPDTWRSIYCYVLQIDKTSEYAIIALPKRSGYTFSPNKIPNQPTALGSKTCRVLLVGNQTNSKTQVASEWFWKYMALITVRDSLTNKVIEASSAELVVAPELAGIDWSVFSGPDNKDRELKVRIADTVRGVISNHNKVVDEYKKLCPELGLVPSTPPASSVEYKALNYQYKSQVGANLKDELDSFRKEYEATSDIASRVNKQQERFKKVADGLDVTDKGVKIHDANYKELSTHNKAELKSVYSNVDYRKAKWNAIRARGRTFNTLLEKTPSTLIQPLTTFTKALGDVTDISVASLLAIISIISIGGKEPKANVAESKRNMRDEGRNL